MNTNILQTTITYVVTALNRRFIRECEAMPVHLPPSYIDRAAKQFAETLPQYIIDSLNGRFERGVVIALAQGVSMNGDPFGENNIRQYWVNSSKPLNPPYWVYLDAGTCTCPDCAKGYYCKHKIAANIIHIGRKLWIEGQRSFALKVEETPPAPLPEPMVEMKEPPPPNTTAPQADHLIWAIIRVDGKLCGVEVLDIQGEQVTVKALPSITKERKLRPCFPFEGKRVIATVHKSELSNVKVFR